MQPPSLNKTPLLLLFVERGWGMKLYFSLFGLLNFFDPYSQIMRRLEPRQKFERPI